MAAWADPVSGPGWANTLVAVLVFGADGDLRIERLQPKEQSAEVRALYAVSAAVNVGMVRAVKGKK